MPVCLFVALMKATKKKKKKNNNNNNNNKEKKKNKNKKKKKNNKNKNKKNKQQQQQQREEQFRRYLTYDFSSLKKNLIARRKTSQNKKQIQSKYSTTLGTCGLRVFSLRKASVHIL